MFVVFFFLMGGGIKGEHGSTSCEELLTPVIARVRACEIGQRQLKTADKMR